MWWKIVIIILALFFINYFWEEKAEKKKSKKRIYKFLMGITGLSSKMCKLIFRRSYDRHIYYLKL
ncbi:hypothetical protein AALB52_25705, partial [Lachnospiraceae bacterium 38-14]